MMYDVSPIKESTKLWKEVNGIIRYETFEIIQCNKYTFDLSYTTDGDEINRTIVLVASSDETLVKLHYDASIRTAVRKGWKEVPYLNKDDIDKNTP